MYAGTTASGARPREARQGLHRALRTPAVFLRRLLTLQWLPVDGCIAADTDHYPFGTRIHVPGYGWVGARTRSF